MLRKQWDGLDEEKKQRWYDEVRRLRTLTTKQQKQLDDTQMAQSTCVQASAQLAHI